MKNINLKGALLLISGIAIGIALTTICMQSVQRYNAEHKQIASHTPAADAPHPAAHPHPGAAIAISHHQAVAPQTANPHAGQQHPVAQKTPHDWLTPADIAAQSAGGNASGAKANAQESTYKSSHTTYYVYGDPSAHTLPAAAGGFHPAVPTAVHLAPGMVPGAGTIVTDSVYTMPPCVDPPSVTRGRAYRQPVVH